MDHMKILVLIASATPFIVALLKWFIPDIKDPNTKNLLVQSLALLTGICCAVLNNRLSMHEPWSHALIDGISGGAMASYVRDFDKNFVGLADVMTKLKDGSSGQSN